MYPGVPLLDSPHAEPPAPTLFKHPLLAHVPHAFSTRVGGVSVGPFASLNFGNPMDLPPDRRDPPERIATNWDRLRAALGTPDRPIIQVHQVHGPDAFVRSVLTPEHAAITSNPSVKADALVTDDPSCLLAVRVADCAPVLMADATGRLVAAIHAGWRGMVAGVVPRAAHALRELAKAHGLPSPDLAAVVGPCIGPEAFEVGPEVVDAVRTSLALHPDDPGPISHLPGDQARGKARLDLAGAILRQLAACGISRTARLPHCTVREPELFFSHRRDAGHTGRMVGVIGPAPRHADFSGSPAPGHTPPHAAHPA